MDITFHCSKCRQDLAVDSSAAGSTIQCPTCNAEITVPQPDAANIHILNPIAASAAAKIERHFSVPVHDAPSEVLIKQPTRIIEEVAPGQKQIKMKIFRHSDCVEVGHDRYEEMVSAFLNKVGEENIVSITSLNYTHVDIGSQRLLTDYAVQILYRS
jgi:DNA-directed RNA polymerase subunit RPC12/RpoP